jgi:hypothetical protein
MRRLIFYLTITLVCAACTPAKAPTAERHEARALYNAAFKDATAPYRRVKRNHEKNNFIAQEMEPGLRSLSKNVDGCENYAAYIQSAKSLADEAASVLASNDPQKYRPYFYMFKKACNCHDVEAAEQYAKPLIGIRTELFGKDSADAAAITAELKALREKESAAGHKLVPDSAHVSN